MSIFVRQPHRMTKKAPTRTTADVMNTCMVLASEKDIITEDEHRQRERNVLEAAGRRVYSQLLLNAWRHKRRDASALADSSALLHQQVRHTLLYTGRPLYTPIPGAAAAAAGRRTAAAAPI